MVEPDQVAVRRQELVLPHLLQLPGSVTLTLVHLLGDLDSVQFSILSKLDFVNCAWNLHLQN